MANTKHSQTCHMAFGRKDPCCPRCQELMAGAAPRDGWQKTYYERKAREDRQRSEAIKAHFRTGGPHDTGECGPVCTAFDW